MLPSLHNKCMQQCKRTYARTHIGHILTINYFIKLSIKIGKYSHTDETGKKAGGKVGSSGGTHLHRYIHIFILYVCAPNLCTKDYTWWQEKVKGRSWQFLWHKNRTLSRIMENWRSEVLQLQQGPLNSQWDKLWCQMKSAKSKPVVNLLQDSLSTQKIYLFIRKYVIFYKPQLKVPNKIIMVF